MAVQSFTSGQTLTSAQMNSLQANDYNLSVTTQTGNYTLVAADKGTREVANSASAITFTVNNSVFTAGDMVEIHNIGAGLLTIAAGAGVTINSADVLTVSQWQGGTLYFTSASAAIWFPRAKTVSSGAVAQVKSTSKTDSFTLSFTTTFTDVTGLSVSITPTSASNNVLVIAQVTAGAGAGGNVNLRLMRGSTAIGIGDAASNRIRIGSGDVINADYQMSSNTLMVLDSPATTSATTYNVQMCAQTGQGATYVNRSNTDSDSASYNRGASSITVFEVTP